MKLSRREYQIEARNGYWALDEYLNGKCIRTIQTFTSKANAEYTLGLIENALNDFIKDNNLEVE